MYKPTKDQMQHLKKFLNTGYNLLEYEISGRRIQAKIFLVTDKAKIVISDVDGTITKYGFPQVSRILCDDNF